MNKLFCKTVILISFFFLSAGFLYSQQLAFPTAEGFGKYTVGGRGGAVYEVTNLNNSGAGSLRAAVQASGARTVVFRVSGTINLSSRIDINNPYITIAGQTAPGDGICLKNYKLNINTNEVIIRYIRVRPGNGGDLDDAISNRYNKNIVLDHVSASWSSDETMSLYHGEKTTIQWCMITESMNFDNHGFAAIWGSDSSTYHHNLIAHHRGRAPRWASGCKNVDYRNNVIYNWYLYNCNGGEAHQVGDVRFNFAHINMIANYYKSGPASGSKSQIADPGSRDGDADAGQWWFSDNFVVGYPNVTADNWKGVTTSRDAYKLAEPWPAMAINQQTAEEAYQLVLANAGAILPKRDSVDLRVIEEVRNGTATYGTGIINSQSEVGGWPALSSTTAPADGDNDGMPDDWEDANGLDKTVAADRNGIGADGYTNLEIYLNSIAEFPAFLYYPVNVTAELKDLTEVELTWDIITEDETEFKIERAIGDTGIFDSIGVVGVGVTSFVDSGLEELTLYRYRVLAFNDSLTSWYEKIVPITTLGSTSLPAAVSDPLPRNNALNIGADTTLMWKASVNAESYDVYFGTENPPPFVLNQEGATYKPGGLASGTRYYWRINGKNSNGTTEGSVWSFKVEGTLSSVAETVPDKSIFIRNYPNPFSSFTTINYELKSHSEVKLFVYNVMGEKVATLVNQWQTAGEHAVTFDASNLESGVYFFSIKTDLSEQRGKMLLMK